MPVSLKSLRYSTAIAVSLVALSTANQAYAQCAPATGSAGDDMVACSGASAAIDLQAGIDTLTNAAGGTLDGVGDIAIRKAGGTLNLTNDGTITNAADANNEATIDIGAGTTSATITNTATGVISNTGGTGPNREAIDVNVGTVIINNAGTISSTNNTIGMGGGNTTINNAAGAIISSTATGNSTITWDTGGVIDNSGTIIGARRAIGLQASGTLTNRAGATIESTGAGGAIYLIDGGTIINNSGNIINDSAGNSAITHNLVSGDFQGAINNLAGGVIRGNQNGIEIDEPSGSSTGEISGAITNAGTIQGVNGAGIFGRAIDDSSSSASARFTGGIVNSGTITGDRGIYLIGSVATFGEAILSSVENSGTIEGTGGTAIEFSGASGTTAININGGRIIGNVVDDFTNGHLSNVTITGSGFDTEGDFTVSSLGVNAGQEFRISTGDTFNTATMSNAGTINFEVDAAGAVGLLNVTGGAINLTGGSVGAEVDPTALLVDGQEILIGTGTADVIGTTGVTGQALTTVTDDYLLLDFAIADGGQAEITGSADASELYFRVFQSAGLCDGVAIPNPDAACGVLSTLVGTTNTQISNIISNITNSTSEAERENILNATLPKVDGSLQAAKQVVTGNTIRIVSDRLTVLRDPTSGNFSGVSSGDPTSDHDDHQMWGQVFGQKARQGARKGQSPYDIHTRGVTVGADMEAFEHAVVGAAFTYANTSVRTESANNTATDVDSYSLSLYGDYDMLDGLAHIIGTVGYTYSNKEKIRFNVGAIQGLNASSDFDSQQFEARLIGNYDFHPYDLPEWHIIPRVQVHYMGQQTGDIEETGAGGANLKTESEFHNLLEVGVGVDVQYEFDLGDGASLTPDVSAHYRYDVLGDKLRTTSTFDGGGASFVSEGAEPDQGTWNFGLALNYHASNDVEISVSYDHEKKDKFKSHAGFIRAAVPF